MLIKSITVNNENRKAEEEEELVDYDFIDNIHGSVSTTLNRHPLILDDYPVSGSNWNENNIHQQNSFGYENFQSNFNIQPETVTILDEDNDTIILNDYSLDLIDNIENNKQKYSPKLASTLPPMPHQRMINVRELIRNGNLNELEEIVLQGYGERLLTINNNNTAAPLVQEFLDNLPNYLVCKK